jgi:hypothetical protein
MAEQERPWVRIAGAVILGGASVAAALVPLYCAKQTRLAETNSTVQTNRSEIEDLNQRLSQANQAIASRDVEIAQLRKRTAALPECPPAALSAATPEQPAAATSGGAAATPGPLLRSTLEREVEFGLRGCHLSGTTLTCDLLFTSKGADRDLGLLSDARSRLIDPVGREVRATRFVAGARRSCDGCGVDASLPSDVPIAGQVAFEGVQQNTRHVQLMELNCNIRDPAGGWHNSVIKFPGFDL